MSKEIISVVVPCFNEEEAIPVFVEEINKTAKLMLEKYDVEMEYIFVDDGSKDKTAKVIRAHAQQEPRAHYILLSRNFGKEGAMFAGLDNARGECAVITDADLQFPPETIAEMYAVWSSGEADIVEGKKRTRGKESLVY